MIKIANNLEKLALSIRDESPLYMRPVSGIAGRVLGSPMTALTLGITSPFKPGPESDEDHIKETIKLLAKDKNLDNTEVYLNDVHPLDNLVKVWKNKRTGIGTKLLGTVQSPLIDMQTALMRADHYNPFSDTATVFTNEPGILAHELGHAQDFNSREYPGLYALSRGVPIVNWFTTPYQEYIASEKAMKTLNKNKAISDEELNRAGSILSAGFGSYAGNIAGELVGAPGALALPGAWVGRLTGKADTFGKLDSRKSKAKPKKKAKGNSKKD